MGNAVNSIIPIAATAVGTFFGGPIGGAVAGALAGGVITATSSKPGSTIPAPPTPVALPSAPTLDKTLADAKTAVDSASMQQQAEAADYLQKRRVAAKQASLLSQVDSNDLNNKGI